MKNLAIALSILSLVLTGALYYLHFSSQHKIEKVSVATQKTPATDFRIAYFDIDSLQANYEHYKDALEEMKKTEKSMNAELQNLKERFQRRIGELQQKGPTMTQQEGEEAQREMMMMENTYSKREAQLQDDLQEKQMKIMKALKQEIESYLEEYNKEKEYAYIFSYEPGFMLYYRDSAYNITTDVVNGLNERYRKNKTKKQ